MPPVDHVRHHRAQHLLSPDPGTPGDPYQHYSATGYAGGAPMPSPRRQQPRHEMRNSRDQLLEGRLQRINPGKLQPNFRRMRATALLYAVGMTLVCFVPYLAMLFVWFAVYNTSFAPSIMIFLMLVLIGWLLCVASRKSVLNVDRPWLWWLGALFAKSAVVGLVLGYFVYFHLLCYYYTLEGMRTYTNVAASQSARAFKDGGILLFSEDTRVDALRAVGFRSKWTGQFYCVAPIVDNTMGDGVRDINYWAVGEDCCSPRAEFLCDDASDWTARSALVMLQPGDVVRPYMRWAVGGATYPYYRDAIRLQEATYSTKSVPEPKLVHWSRNPEGYKESWFRQAVRTCAVFSAAYGVYVLVLTFTIAYKLQPRKRPEGIIRQ